MSTRSYGEELSREYTISSTVLLSLYDKRTQPHTCPLLSKEGTIQHTETCLI